MQRERLTPDRIRRFACPEGTAQAFLWDTEAPRLAVRATAGAKAYVFESKLNRRTIRATIGDVRAWCLDDARTEARRLQTLVDQGIDPRQEKADKLAAFNKALAESDDEPGSGAFSSRKKKADIKSSDSSAWKRSTASPDSEVTLSSTPYTSRRRSWTARA